MFFDGALVGSLEDEGEIYVRPISGELVRQIVEFAHRSGITFDLHSVTHYYIEKETWVTDIRREFFGLQPTIVDFVNLWQKERIIKGTLVVCSDEERAKVDSFFLRFKDILSFSWTKTPAYPKVDFINVLAPHVSKGVALEVLASFLGIPLIEVIAVGDGVNDFSLLSKAGLAVAMGNSPDELKAMADYVTLDVDHSGVAAVINKFLL